MAFWALVGATRRLSSCCNTAGLACQAVRIPNRESVEGFQQLVADLLDLPAGSNDAAVREALRAKGEDLVVWYDTRLLGITGSKLRAAPPNNRHH
jgi:hypothetical protein